LEKNGVKDRLKREDIPLEVQNKIIQAISEIKYGSVNITVQDGHVIQIDKLEKERIK
jgi:hypothetical protein